jgi:hypothetical protein
MPAFGWDLAGGHSLVQEIPKLRLAGEGSLQMMARDLGHRHQCTGFAGFSGGPKTMVHLQSIRYITLYNSKVWLTGYCRI